jgi:hypothetical protein
MIKHRHAVTIVIMTLQSLYNVAADAFPSCFDMNETNKQLQDLVYPDGSRHSVQIPFFPWTSVQINAHMTRILLNEIMRYSVVFIPLNLLVTDATMSIVAGCVDVMDCSCVNRYSPSPKIHVTLETWSGGVQRHHCLPADARPYLVNTLKYRGDDSYFLWSKVSEAG